MVELDSRNVLLKGSQKRQIMAWLKRPLQLGQRIGDFVMKLTIQKVGRCYEVKAQVQDQAGTFMCRSRRHEVLGACREVTQQLKIRLHNQKLQRAA